MDRTLLFNSLMHCLIIFIFTVRAASSEAETARSHQGDIIFGRIATNGPLPVLSSKLKANHNLRTSSERITSTKDADQLRLVGSSLSVRAGDEEGEDEEAEKNAASLSNNSSDTDRIQNTQQQVAAIGDHSLADNFGFDDIEKLDRVDEPQIEGKYRLWV